MRRAWILVNLGTPAAPTPAAVRAFLAEFLSDPMVVDFPPLLWRPILHGILLRTRPARVAHAYRAIWSPEGSPLAAGTAALVRALAGLVPDDVTVHAAYRYGGEERVDRVLARVLAEADHAVVTTLFPQPTASSSGTIDALVRAAAASAASAPSAPSNGARVGAGERVRLAPLSPVAPGYVDAQVERIEDAERRLASGRADHVVLSFHGIPARVNARERGTYSRACEATSAAIAARLARAPETITLAYQSKFGPGAWLSPATADVLVERARAGSRSLVVATPGFLTPGLETLEELGLRGRKDFLDAGGTELCLADPPTDHPLFLRELTALLQDSRTVTES